MVYGWSQRPTPRFTTLEANMPWKASWQALLGRLTFQKPSHCEFEATKKVRKQQTCIEHSSSSTRWRGRESSKKLQICHNRHVTVASPIISSSVPGGTNERTLIVEEKTTHAKLDSEEETSFAIFCPSSTYTIRNLVIHCSYPSFSYINACRLEILGSTTNKHRTSSPNLRVIAVNRYEN